MSDLLPPVEVEIFSAYNPPESPGLDCAGAGEEGRSMTKQSMRDDTDINVIVARYVDTGFLPQVQNLGVFEDVSEYGDFRTVLDRVHEVEQVFMQLPAEVRTRFGNEAAAFVDFMADPANLAEARELGLVEPEPVAPVALVDEVPGPGIQSRDPVTGQFTSPK